MRSAPEKPDVFRKDSSVTWNELGPFTVFDLETTGMNRKTDRIVEIAAIRIDRDGTQSVFESLVNPCRMIPPSATAVHHITDAMVAPAPRFAEAGRRFLDFAEGTTLVAHNALFDLSFLQESCARTGLPLWNGKTLDSLRLVRKTHPGLASYKLQYLRSVLPLDPEEDRVLQAHRAGSDVVWTVELLKIALTRALQICTPQE